MYNFDNDDDDLTFEQIKKLQQDRKNGVVSSSSEKYNSSIDTSSKKRDKDKDRDRDRGRVGSKKGEKRKSSDGLLELNDDDHHEKLRREFDSYHAPKHILDTIPVDPEEDDPLKRYRPQTVAERETEYQGRWRKRSFSPPRDYDPFTGKGDVKGRSYRDIMIETQLAREEKEIMLKISKKQREEDELKRKEKRNEQAGKSSKNDSNKKQRVSASGNESSSSNGSGNGREKLWFIKVFKNGQQQDEPISIQKDKTITFGRDLKNIVVLEHPSCSSSHATITIYKEGKRPILLDLRSTNQTHLNNRAIEPHHPEELYHGDIIKFGGSTREYIINHN